MNLFRNHNMVSFFEVIYIKIKVKEISKKGIKVLDKSITGTQKFKDRIVEIKDRTNEATNNDVNSDNEYASNHISNIAREGTSESIYTFNRVGKKSFINTKKNIKNIKKKRLDIKSKKVSKAIKRKTKINKPIQKTKNTIKKSELMRKKFINGIKTTVRGVKATIKVTVSSIKAIISGTKALIELLIAGGWIAVVIIIVVCMIAGLCSSIYGIFFSNEKTSKDSITMSSVITTINGELNTKIDNIKKENPSDDYRINYNTANWKDVLIIYTSKVSNGNNNSEVMTMDNKKINILKGIFLDMNLISYEIKEEANSDEIGGIKKVLYININKKSIDDMMNIYHFNITQKNQVKELLNNKHNSLWSSVIGGSSEVIGDYFFPVGGFYTITQYYSDSHKALDIASNYGSNIYSASNGVVYTVKGGCIAGDITCNGKGGNYVIIKHDDNIHYSTYMHLRNFIVKEGDKVSAGEIIGYMGNTGNVIPVPPDSNSKNGKHLHFVIYNGIPYRGGVEINPLK